MHIGMNIAENPCSTNTKPIFDTTDAILWPYELYTVVSYATSYKYSSYIVLVSLKKFLQEHPHIGPYMSRNLKASHIDQDKQLDVKR